MACEAQASCSSTRCNSRSWLELLSEARKGVNRGQHQVFEFCWSKSGGLAIKMIGFREHRLGPAPGPIDQSAAKAFLFTLKQYIKTALPQKAQ